MTTDPLNWHEEYGKMRMRLAESEQLLKMFLEHHDAGCVSCVPCAIAEDVREFLDD